MRDGGVLIGLEGPLGYVLKIRPPLVFRIENADRLVDSPGRALAAISATRARIQTLDTARTDGRCIRYE
jgi:hypothetical protein